jgi:hypothetical protein
MEQPATCGQGLAAHAPLPAMLGELTAAVGKILELHIPALDLDDPNGRQEAEAYRVLVEAHRETADQLQKTAEAMRGYRDLPMARHDMEALASPASLDAFRRFVGIEQDLLALLQARLEDDQEMLRSMEGEAA